jgi:anti-sigma factor RsiW
MSARRADRMDESVLSAYADAELDADARAEVEARLAESPEWRAVLDEVRATRDAVRGLSPVAAPPGFWERVLATDPEVVILATARERRSHVHRWTALAAATAAAAVLGVAVVPRSEPVEPALATLTQVHAERASLGNDVVTNLAGAVVPVSPDP